MVQKSVSNRFCFSNVIICLVERAQFGWHSVMSAKCCEFYFAQGLHGARYVVNPNKAKNFPQSRTKGKPYCFNFNAFENEFAREREREGKRGDSAQSVWLLN